MKFRVLLLLLLAVRSASAMFMPPKLVPMETLEKNASAYTAAHPAEANGWYVSARIHYLAFVSKSAALATVGSGQDENGLPLLYRGYGTKIDRTIEMQREAQLRALKKMGLDEVPMDDRHSTYLEAYDAAVAEMRAANWTPPVPAPEELLRHVRQALADFDKALSLAPDNALYQLGKASLLQQYADEQPALEKAGLKDLPAVEPVDGRAAAFYKAFVLAKTKDAASKSLPLLGISDLVSHEAGEAYLKLLPGGDKVEEVRVHLDKLNALPMGPITPIVFSMDREVSSIGALLEPGLKVTFDLAGFGRADAWPWVKPGTSLLVWDPAGEANIRDGKQLFGTYTWGIFWENGFRALAMLDDNHDGVLSGRELEGLAAWNDTDGDGVSSKKEVVPLSNLHIRSIATHENGSEGIHPWNLEGLGLEDGTTRPLWDWTTNGVSPER
ncbi:hypothetical protein KBB96_00860 [Luteolibacter ambystomatis]|uniref:EF-hand domain-containing protein n=1 Tax=Luteolibacter ambystomatis TaxID=2824561 RepID=A0A975IZU1_9BACT|nr:hypothetical protein [Luteolibacter ambystomatis]QUE51463.1 hypothetical protein KBB96_00860 [Luteolibacter ambystomatis]